ncbi:MAG: 50S ribosomal protein L21 [Nitrospirae bacterium]|nr:50S ribosomal protein L21 [Nitrospirota bacterium]
MFAIVDSGGKQFRVSPNETVKVEKIIGADDGSEIILDKVLALSSDSGMKIGSPYIEGAKVKGQVISNGRTKKIDVFKMKPRKNYRKLTTSRKYFTLIRIAEIIGG